MTDFTPKTAVLEAHATPLSKSASNCLVITTAKHSNRFPVLYSAVKSFNLSVSLLVRLLLFLINNVYSVACSGNTVIGEGICLHLSRVHLGAASSRHIFHDEAAAISVFRCENSQDFNTARFS